MYVPNPAMKNLISILSDVEIEQAIKKVINNIDNGVGYLRLTDHYELMATTNKNYGGGGAGIYLLFNQFGIGRGMAQKTQKVRGL